MVCKQFRSTENFFIYPYFSEDIFNKVHTIKKKQFVLKNYRVLKECEGHFESGRILS